MASSKLNRFILHLFHGYIFDNKQRVPRWKYWFELERPHKKSVSLTQPEEAFGDFSPSPTCSVVGLERPILIGQLVINRSSNK